MSVYNIGMCTRGKERERETCVTEAVDVRELGMRDGGGVVAVMSGHLSQICTCIRLA